MPTVGERSICTLCDEVIHWVQPGQGALTGWWAHIAKARGHLARVDPSTIPVVVDEDRQKGGKVQRAKRPPRIKDVHEQPAKYGTLPGRPKPKRVPGTLAVRGPQADPALVSVDAAAIVPVVARVRHHDLSTTFANGAALSTKLSTPGRARGGSLAPNPAVPTIPPARRRLS